MFRFRFSDRKSWRKQQTWRWRWSRCRGARGTWTRTRSEKFRISRIRTCSDWLSSPESVDCSSATTLVNQHSIPFFFFFLFKIVLIFFFCVLINICVFIFIIWSLYIYIHIISNRILWILVGQSRIYILCKKNNIIFVWVLSIYSHKFVSSLKILISYIFLVKKIINLKTLIKRVIY